MVARYWNLLTLGITLVIASMVAGSNAALDIYGLFRDSAHRVLPAYGDQRLAKYLLSARYVPSNFDGVLIGSSVSVNWKMGGMRSFRIYNESVNGGNFPEGKRLLDRVLESPRVRLVLLVVHPYLTSSHDFKTVQLNSRQVWGALGSRNLLDAYKEIVKIRFGLKTQTADGAGAEDFEHEPKKLMPRIAAIMRPGQPIELDPIAVEQYRMAIAELHAQNIRVVFVIPPTVERIFALKRKEFLEYNRIIMEGAARGDLVIDFTTDKYREFRADETNFSDGVHLTRPGAARLVALLDEQLEALKISETDSRSSGSKL